MLCKQGIVQRGHTIMLEDVIKEVFSFDIWVPRPPFTYCRIHLKNHLSSMYTIKIIRNRRYNPFISKINDFAPRKSVENRTKIPWITNNLEKRRCRSAKSTHPTLRSLRGSRVVWLVVAENARTLTNMHDLLVRHVIAKIGTKSYAVDFCLNNTYF